MDVKKVLTVITVVLAANFLIVSTIWACGTAVLFDPLWMSLKGVITCSAMAFIATLWSLIFL